MTKLATIFEKCLDWLFDSTPQLTRLVAMRQAKETKCVCNSCSDLLSRIHFDGALTKHAHSLEKDNIGFWNNNLLETYEPEFKPEPEADLCQSQQTCSFDYVSIGQVESDDSKSSSDQFWTQHYANMLRRLKKWRAE